MAEIYNWDKYLKESKSYNTKNPSFSSTLLDEIYRSIDGSDEKFGEFKLRKEKFAKKQSVAGTGAGGGRGRVKSSSAVEDEEIATFRRACLVEKWMETKANEKALMGRRGVSTLPEFDRKMALDNDPLFFSSGSSSSDSSFGWFSEAEMAKPKPSCFGPFNKPKQVKTNVSPRSVLNKQNEFCFFDDYNSDYNSQRNKTTDHNSGLIRSKSRALKIYTSLKKVKQPISPGGRLTTFINSIFTNSNVKKSKDQSQMGFEDRNRIKRGSKSTNLSTCSSASSFSRSCLSKNSPRSRDKLNNGVQRTVRFFVDKDSRPCEKIICNEQTASQRNEKPNFEEFFTRYDDRKEDFDDNGDEEDDMASDSSSDLFELDHLAIFKNEQYCEELPVYGTTHFDTNRAIASGLIC